jgi:predicted negative regulator of RcsB-dependent stress response
MVINHTGLVSSENIYLFYIIGFLVGMGEYIGYLYWKKRKKSDNGVRAALTTNSESNNLA